MSKKTHLVSTTEPLKSKETALCKEVIEKPTVVHVWDSLSVGAKLDLAEWSAITTCVSCFTKVQGISEGRETIYAVQDSER